MTSLPSRQCGSRCEGKRFRSSWPGEAQGRAARTRSSSEKRQVRTRPGPLPETIGISSRPFRRHRSGLSPHEFRRRMEAKPGPLPSNFRQGRSSPIDRSGREEPARHHGDRGPPTLTETISSPRLTISTRTVPGLPMMCPCSATIRGPERNR